MLVFYTQQLSSTIAQWKSIRINMMIYKEKKDSLDKNTQTQQYEMLKVKNFLNDMNNNSFISKHFIFFLES